MKASKSKKARPAEETSDVWRYRGLLSSSVLGAAVVLGVLFTGAGRSRTSPGTELGPGRLGPGHRAASLACSDCHAHDRPSDSCSGCHAGQSSTRAGHRALLAQGRMLCVTCHTAHEPLTVSFAPSGAVFAEGPGGVQKLPGASLYRPKVPARVPMVRSSACAACHRTDRALDPIRGCLPEFGAGVSVCFDEHQAAFATAARTAAWDAAGAVARQGLVTRLDAPAASAPGALLALGLGLFAAALSFFGLRALGRRRVAPGAPQPSPVTSRGKVRLPQIDPNTCLGCYACVDACPFDVLEVERFVAKVARPDVCCGLTLCEQKCPNGSLSMGEGERVDRGPLLDENLEAPDAPGLFLAGDLSGLSLIRNAINQGAAVAHHVADVLDEQGPSRTRGDETYDLLIVGAGPAGLSASLEAKRRGLFAVTLEQWDVAAGIRSFPRHKLVLDAGVPGDERASLWLEECSKEELLSKWLFVAKKERLPIHSGRRVSSVERGPDGYRVEALDERGQSARYRAKNVLLAMGKRGTPRKLKAAVPESWQGRVHYALVDARPFAEKNVLVVGLGDSAMEAAVALAEQPQTRVTIAYRGAGFRRGKTKNQHRVRRLADEGRISLWFDSEVSAFREGEVVLSRGKTHSSHSFDAVFVLVGSLLPWDFLRSVGVRRADEA